MTQAIRFQSVFREETLCRRQDSDVRRRPRGLLIVFVGVVLVAGAGVRPATAGLPGYVEWVLWKEIRTRTSTTPDEAGARLEWVVGPYATLSECEQDRDWLAGGGASRAPRPLPVRVPVGGAVVVIGSSDNIVIRLFCAPDTVNPRVDRRWP